MTASRYGADPARVVAEALAASATPQSSTYGTTRCSRPTSGRTAGTRGRGPTRPRAASGPRAAPPPECAEQRGERFRSRQRCRASNGARRARNAAPRARAAGCRSGAPSAQPASSTPSSSSTDATHLVRELRLLQLADECVQVDREPRATSLAPASSQRREPEGSDRPELDDVARALAHRELLRWRRFDGRGAFDHGRRARSPRAAGSSPCLVEARSARAAGAGAARLVHCAAH